MQSSVLSGCAIFQIVIIAAGMHRGARSIAGYETLKWLGSMLFTKVFGLTLVTQAGAHISQIIILKYPTTLVCLAFWVLAAAASGLFWRIARLGGAAGRLCLGMALLSLLVNLMGSVGTLDALIRGDWRYFFPGLLLIWLMVVIVSSEERRLDGKGPWRRGVHGLVALVLLTGVVDAIRHRAELEQRTTPDWQAQVTAWRSDPGSPIHLSPVWWTNDLHLRPHPQ